MVEKYTNAPFRFCSREFEQFVQELGIIQINHNAIYSQLLIYFGYLTKW